MAIYDKCRHGNMKRLKGPGVKGIEKDAGTALTEESGSERGECAWGEDSKRMDGKMMALPPFHVPFRFYAGA